jgi:hypothetical protein
MRHLLPILPDSTQTPPILLQLPPQDETWVEDPKTTIAVLLAQVTEVKAQLESVKTENRSLIIESRSLTTENRRLKQRLNEPIHDRRTSPVPLVLPPDPIRPEVTFQRNDRGHYVRPRFWSVKEHTPMMKTCLRLLKWTALSVFGFTLVVLMAAGLEQISFVNLMLQLAQHLWKPIVVMVMTVVTIAWMAEAV